MVGRHRVEFEERVAHVRYVGDVDGDDIDQILESMQYHYGVDEPRIALLVDARELGSLAPEARKRISKAEHLVATAVHGGSFQQRIIANLMIRAINLVQKGATPTRLFAAEDEARGWLAEFTEAPQSEG